ncbi:MAG: DNA repair protein RadA, partial [Deferribacterota bacterium]|nr:DNA repair protein RadA [Deferribacterota bacterium]
MAKSKVLFICNKCGYISNKWLGRCPECNSWDSFDEHIDTKSNNSRVKASEQVKPLKIKDLSFEKNNRIFTDIPEFDQLMGGGIVEGSVVLVGGEPGIGKS